ncbi:MAG: MaoC/PaaZ C-terminal domain-containing protein [Sinimarinibacterium flocculans]|uniref:MaoC/PaaZ C-terminal domain-containing protein n=1 Tax=Sinimarinibacterium flocculans TaxID=985250 RepID=UPI003C472B49
MKVERVVSRPFPEVRTRYSVRDTMLYALGVGACTDPLDERQLRYVYEGSLQALPSLSCVLAHPGFWLKEPELGIDWVKLVHAEQYFTLAAPLPTQCDVVGRYRVTGIVDKGADKGALMYVEKTLHLSDGSPLGGVSSTFFLRGDGGCGNWGEPGRELPATPDRKADGSIDQPMLPIAALIYRLSGDYNPLHADPGIARKAGFDRPILHGLCTYGVACLSLVRALCADDASRLRSMGARFTKPVFPGETLRTEYWTGPDGDVRFRVLSVERDVIVLDRGVATIAN